MESNLPDARRGRAKTAWGHADQSVPSGLWLWPLVSPKQSVLPHRGVLAGWERMTIRNVVTLKNTFI